MAKYPFFAYIINGGSKNFRNWEGGGVECSLSGDSFHAPSKKRIKHFLNIACLYAKINQRIETRLGRDALYLYPP